MGGAESGPVLVGVRNPEHVRQLVRTAADLAGLSSNRVRLVAVAVKDYDSPFGVFDDETILREFAGASHDLVERAESPPNVDLDRDVVTARSASAGLIDAVEDTNATGLVVGWSGPTSRADAVLGTTVDDLVERAPCDLYVERVGREADGVETVFLPVAGGPHVGAAARVAAAIAARNEAQIVIYSVAPDPDERELGASRVTAGQEAIETIPGIDPDIETEVVVDSEPSAAVIAEAANHDVVVLGATRHGAFRRRLTGSIPRRVVDRTDTTVIIARDAASVGGLAARLGRVLRR
ncbi:MAG: universal stress protein [Salinirussus sp.]